MILKIYLSDAEEFGKVMMRLPAVICKDELKVRYTGELCIILKYCVFEVF